jgi:CubicO group peptidase (beta-lactamase class C family)
MSERAFDETMIHGAVAPGFEEVREEFVRNFRERGEVGAACAIYHKGRKVVDLWGGLRDERSGEPWRENTLVLVFSTTKGLAGMCIALAHSRGWIDYEQPVATYWPEFAQNGKGHITVRQMLSHQAGLCALDTPLTLEVLADPDEVARIIARQKPAWTPGQCQGYHAISLGFYEGELLRRVDPQHHTLGRFFAEEIATPLGLEFYIGLPACVPDDRLARIRMFSRLQLLLHMNTLPPKLVLSYLWPWSLPARAFDNPKLKPFDVVNTRQYLEVESPAGNGIGQVRSIARAYSAFAAGGAELDIRPQTLDLLTALPCPPPAGHYDRILKFETSYGLGFVRPYHASPFSSSPRAFGMPGLGGSFGFADPDAQLGYAYAPNKLGFYLHGDPREKALRKAMYRCLDGRG